jgi:hypothetical protein
MMTSIRHEREYDTDRSYVTGHASGRSPKADIRQTSVILFTVLDPSAVLNCIEAQGYKGTIAMNEMTLDKDNEELLTYEVSDEVLEFAACAERDKANTFTQWICTSAYFCPGP